MRIYSLNTRIWLKRLQPERPLRLHEVPPAAWRFFAERSDALWLMGVWQNSAQDASCWYTADLISAYKAALPDWRPEDVSGSPFAIRDYTVHADFGTLAGLARVRKHLNSMGLKLILDFIPNHYSKSSPLIAAQPKAFLQAPADMAQQDGNTFFQAPGSRAYFAHGRDPFFPAWQDTVQVNFFHPQGRELQLKKLLSLAPLCDGLRCDMAMLALTSVFARTWGPVIEPMGLQAPAKEFWQQAIARVKEFFPDFLFIAEAYWGKEPELQALGFDLTYDKSLLDYLRAQDCPGLRAHISNSGGSGRWLRFIENHDEQRAAVSLGYPRALAAALICTTLPGSVLLHDGQLTGKTVHLPLQLNREPGEPVHQETAWFYGGLLPHLRHPAFTQGDWTWLEVAPADPGNSAQHLFAWLWRYEENMRLVVVNYSEDQACGRIRLPVKRQDTVVLQDLLTQSLYLRSARELSSPGLFVLLGGFQCHLFAFSLTQA